MVIRKPLIKMVEDKEGNKTPVIQKFEQKYDEDDLILDFMYETEDENDEAESDELPFAEEVAETVDANDTSWLDNL